ncbi:hypothetical protein OH720_29410 [Pseudomonas sp. WJP1]|uniref:DUF3757 domain-containing protein n=1 Tax=Pseudomonas sp. WJP1 TaxID=2986947 RepID=UPI002349A33D|nr:DUF3757 domain-containing protein [Pseudomonas sp. WJP1]WCM51007.1 hypothetical protein OH720_29410 [Pseudomonas sp. WJP1]
MRSTITTSLLMTLMAIGNAYAASAVCPAVSEISQVKDEHEGGYEYFAPGPNNRVWVGSNPKAEEHHIKTFEYTGALYRDVSSQGNTFVVSCDYEGEDFLAFTRLTLYSFKDWKPAANTLWKREVNKQPPAANKNAKHVEACGSEEQEKCAFEYSSLSAAQAQK